MFSIINRFLRLKDAGRPNIVKMGMAITVMIDSQQSYPSLREKLWEYNPDCDEFICDRDADFSLSSDDDNHSLTL